MVRLFKRWLAARRAESELRALDDRTLRDLGISRGMIKHIVRQEAYRLYP